MRSRWALLSAFAWMLLATGAVRVPAASWPWTVDPEHSYFPLQVGNQWVYQGDTSLCSPYSPCFPHISTTISVTERIAGNSGSAPATPPSSTTARDPAEPRHGGSGDSTSGR